MKGKLIYFCFILVVFYSCSNEDDGLVSIEQENPMLMNVHKITKEKAIDIAEDFFGKTTRAGTPSFMVDYVLSDNKNVTRSCPIGNDTLAYVLNIVKNGGFMVVATDNRVFPILAYSEKGNLTYEKSDDDIVYANFISRLKGYMESIQETDSAVIVPENYLDGCQVVSPKLATTWNQRTPYDKYVIQEHPGCPVGCVAVATGQVMTCCKSLLSNYHGTKFYLKSMNDAFKESVDNSSNSTRIIGGYFPTYTYEEAADYAAKLLYFIGKDVDMIYATGGSGAFSFLAYDLLDSLGFNLKENYLTTYSDTAIARSVYNGYVIYMRGADTGGAGGHAWIIDGCSFCWSTPYPVKLGIQNVLLHCNWGWNGKSDGYFSGEVFRVSGYAFSNMEYFSVRKE